jgi:uncharacterized protein
VTAHPTSLRLRVVPGASRPGVVGRYREGWKVRVTAAPEAGKANDAVLALLATTLVIPRHDLALTSGASSRDKVVRLVGISSDDADARLAAAAKAVA